MACLHASLGTYTTIATGQAIKVRTAHPGDNKQILDCGHDHCGKHTHAYIIGIGYIGPPPPSFETAASNILSFQVLK